MSHENPSEVPRPMACADVRDLLYLFTCDELDAEERRDVEAHLTGCPACTKAFEEHEFLKRALPSGFVDRKLFYYSKDA
jgi:anti-sigma factor RsiW